MIHLFALYTCVQYVSSKHTSGVSLMLCCPDCVVCLTKCTLGKTGFVISKGTGHDLVPLSTIDFMLVGVSQFTVPGDKRLQRVAPMH